MLVREQWLETRVASRGFWPFNELSGRSSFAVVVVNDTFLKDDFQTLLGAIPVEKLMFVGDEVHRHGTRPLLAKFPNSAWVCRPPGPLLKRRKHYQSILWRRDQEFGIKDAIDVMLCNYHYQVVGLYSPVRSYRLQRACVIYLCLGRTTTQRWVRIR